jgi:hypothetical protein
VPYHLDSTGVRNLSERDIATILRGADTMIGRGGRTQLSKLLKGSKAASVIDNGLDGCPVYGCYRSMAIEDILRGIDWTIEHNYLRIEYAGRLPVLVFTERGWAIEVETMVEELVEMFEGRLAAGPPYDFSELKDRDREMIFLLLDKIEASERPEFVPLLEAWAAIDYAKVRARIASVIRTLAGSRRLDVSGSPVTET